jgi:hypothetical protein
MIPRMASNTPDDFAKRYDEMSDDALLELANSNDELVPAAEAALEVELERRGLQVTAQNTSVAEHRDLVLIERFRDLTAAQLAQGALESAGIDAVLRDENVVRLDWFYSNAIGGIRLEVDRENAESATEILNQQIPASFEADGEEFHRSLCPACQSPDTEFESISKPLSVTTMWLGFPIPVPKNKWHCSACGLEWEEEENELHPET